MYSHRFAVVFGFVACISSCVSPSCFAASFSCDVGGLRVGAVPDAPFTADIVQGRWEILPDGSRKAMPLKDGEAMPTGGNPNLIGRVARDSQGRVLVERFENNPAQASQTDEPDAWSNATICDPIAGTTTTLSHALAVKDAGDLLSGMNVQTSLDLEGRASVRPWTNRAVGGFGASVYGSAEHLGPEQVDGVSTERYRLLGSVKSEALRVEYVEMIASEEFEAELSRTFVNTVENIEDGIKLIHVKRVEPDKEIYPFKVPAGYAAADTDDKERGHKGHDGCHDRDHDR